MSKILMTSAVILTLASSQAFAESAATNNFYVGVDAGYAKVDTQASKTAQYLANLTGLTTSYTSDDGAFVGRIFAGSNINENISAEIGYFRSSDLTNNYVQARGTANENFRGQGVDFSVLLRPSVSTGLNNLFARVGGHYSEVSGDASVTYVGNTYSLSASGSSNKSGAGFLVGLGYDLPIDKNISARVGYTYMSDLGGVSGANLNLFSAGLKLDF